MLGDTKWNEDEKYRLIPSPYTQRPITQKPTTWINSTRVIVYLIEMNSDNCNTIHWLLDSSNISVDIFNVWWRDRYNKRAFYRIWLKQHKMQFELEDWGWYVNNFDYIEYTLLNL